jgi:hypothetical protein
MWSFISMRVVMDTHGIHQGRCYYCTRPFDVHPKVQQRQERHAALCAIQNDDHAARAFHHYQKRDTEAEACTEVWGERQGFHVHEVGSFMINGICICLEPGVSPEQAMEEFDKCVLPSLRAQLLKTLDGTAQKEAEESKQKIEE